MLRVKPVVGLRKKYEMHALREQRLDGHVTFHFGRIDTVMGRKIGPNEYILYHRPWHVSMLVGCSVPWFQ